MNRPLEGVRVVAVEQYGAGPYGTQLLNTSFPSVYADKTRGVSVELASTQFANHDLHVALHHKGDRHRDTNPKSPAKDYRDVTTAIAVERSEEHTSELQPAHRRQPRET